MSSTASYRFHVLGHVQGVFFRQSTRQRALELQIDGWVRNCDDGSVEGLACGEAAAIDALREWLQHGPATARVETLTWRSEEHTSELQSLMRISYAVFCLKKKTQIKAQRISKNNAAK